MDGGGGGMEGVTVKTDKAQQATTDAGGYYLFRLPAGSYLISPELAGYKFVPPSRPVTIPPSAVLADFVGEVEAYPKKWEQ